MVQRWLYSTNAKDIAVLYFIFAIFCGMAGTAMSLIIRLELAAPGVQYLGGNNQLFNVLVVGHAVLMIFFLVMPALIGGFGNQKRYESNNNNQVIENNPGSHTYVEPKGENNTFNLKLNYDNLGPYLAGLIEGDGTILVQNSSSIKKLKYRPIIVVVFKLEDLELANYLCNLTKCGKVYKKINRNYVLWLIHDLKGVYTLLNIINGYIRTPKYEAFVRSAEFINNYINSTKIVHNKLKNRHNIKIKPLDTSDIGSNAWLAGMTDADGNFSINLINGKNRSSRAMPYYCLELRQNYHNNFNNNNINLSYFNIMSAIALYFNVNLYSRERNLNLLLSLNNTYKLYYSYKVIVANLYKNIKVIEYFNKYSLLSSKHLDFLDWSKLVILINNEGQSIKPNGSWELGLNLRKNYNKTRTTFTWSHLKNTYLINK